MKIRINKIIYTAAICLAPLFFTAFGVAQSVTHNSLPGTNFATFHTYQWANCGGGHPNGIVDTEIKQDVNGVLAGKGFTEVAPKTTSDLLVCYQVAIQQQRQWNAYGMGGLGFGFGGMAQATSSTIDDGTLVFDVYTMANKQLVWQGRAAKTISPSGNQEKNMRNLQKGITKLLKDFPPPVK